MGTWISQRMDQFRCFDEQLGHPEWAHKRVLDYGGNVGNILLDADCTIEPWNYWSLDVSRDAIVEGRRRHTDAHFVFYDRYHCEYNPTGIPNLPIPDLGTTFDYILARSVLTHMTRAQTKGVAADLYAILTPGGTLAMTFMDPHWTPPEGWARKEESPERSNLRWRLDIGHTKDPSVDVESVAQRAERSQSQWLTLLDEGELVLDGDEAEHAKERPHRAFVTFCTVQHMKQVLPHARIEPPIPPDRHHCALIHSSSSLPARPADRTHRPVMP